MSPPTQESKPNRLVWSVDLSALEGKKVQITTHEGAFRVGILTEVRMTGPTIWDGQVARRLLTPVQLRLDDDMIEHIDWVLIERIELLK